MQISRVYVYLNVNFSNVYVNTFSILYNLGKEMEVQFKVESWDVSFVTFSI